MRNLVKKFIEYDSLAAPDLEGIAFWDVGDVEQLLYHDIDESIEQNLDGRLSFDGTLTIYGYQRMSLTIRPDWILEYVLEHLDEDHSDPDGDGTKPTEAMVKAAEVFCDVIRAEYQVWGCEPVIAVNVNIREWVENHIPEWLWDEARESDE